MYWKSVLRPRAYHGASGKSPFFEGWYYKLVTADQSKTIAIIPGIFRGNDAEYHHSFVMVFDGSPGPCKNFRFPINAFNGSESEFEVGISDNSFSSRQVTLDLAEQGVGSVKAQLNLSEHILWPESLMSPGIMGWYAWVPTMECYHGLVSLDGKIDGWIEIDGVKVDFSGGKCYIEKDWGMNFPASWIWIQSNHFGREQTCLTASIARIPWKRSSFPGFIVGMLVQGELHRFATYTGAKVDSLEIGKEYIDWVLSDKKNRLSIRAKRTGGSQLWAPGQSRMELRVEEGLDSVVEVLLEKKAGDVIFEGRGSNAGLEVEGLVDGLRP